MLNRLWRWFMRPYYEDLEDPGGFAFDRWPGPDKLFVCRILPLVFVLCVAGIVWEEHSRSRSTTNLTEKAQ